MRTAVAAANGAPTPAISNPAASSERLADAPSPARTASAAKRLHHGARVLRSRLLIRLEALHDERRQRGRHLRAAGRNRLRRLGQVRADQLMERANAERRLAAEHLVGHAPEGIQVGAMVHRVAGRAMTPPPSN